jgi:hypothetical protein
MANGDASIPDLISTALAQASRLIRDEVQLARAEMSANVSSALTPAAILGAGACVLIASLVLLLEALAAWFAQGGWSEPASHLFAALVGLALTAGLLWFGVSRLSATNLVPRRTVQQVREDVSAVKEHL